MKSAPTIEVISVSAGYRGRPVLRDVSLSVVAGQRIALIGPNGCGKSTLFRVMAGVLRATAGEVHLDGSDLGAGSTDIRIRLGLGYLTQTRNVFAGLSVKENLVLAGESMDAANFGRSTARIEKLFQLFPTLGERPDCRAGLLSGGQRQALATAMVLMRPPKALLLDEPVAGLSPVAAVSLMTAIRSLQADEGFALIVVEHRLKLVQPHVDRVLVMREGRIVDDTTDTERMLDGAWLFAHYTNGSES
jgi:branched-chain amino acid transport system ATP-binding protein